MAKKTTTESKEITIDQEHFKQHGEAFVEAMLRGMLTFDSPDDLFNEESGDYEYFGETLVPVDEGGYTRAVSWMESWVNPGFDKWAKGYGGTKTKKELESFMLEAETDYVKAAEDVLNDAFNAVPLAKKLKATFSLDSDSFGDYGYVVSMDKAGFEKARKAFLAQNIESSGKPIKVNSAIFYNLSKDALIAANYKEAKDMDIRCAVCMHYRGFGQFCPRFWVSVKPDNVCDKHVRLPAKAELKIANGNGNAAMILGAEINPLKRWLVAEIIVGEKGTPVSKKQIAGTFATEKKAQEIYHQFHAKNPNAKVIQWGDFKRLHVTEVGKKRIKLSLVKESNAAVKGPRMTFKAFAADNISNEAIDAIIKNAPKKSLEGEHGFTYWENIADKYSEGTTKFNKAGAAASSKKKANRTEQGEMRDELQDDDMILMDNGDVIVYSQGSGYDSIGNFKSDFHEDKNEMWEAIFVSMNERQYWGNVWHENDRGDPELVTDAPKLKFLKLTKLETPAQALAALKQSGAEDVTPDNAKYHVGEFYLENDTLVKAPFSLRVEKGDKDAAKYGKQKVFFVVNGQDDKAQAAGWLYKGDFYLLHGKWQDTVEGLNYAKHRKGF